MASNDKTAGGLTAQINQRHLFADWTRKKKAAQLGIQTPLVLQSGSGATKQVSIFNYIADGAQFTTAAEQSEYVESVTSLLPVPPAPAPTIPSAPLNIVAVAGDAQAVVSFDAPASDGGAAITSYTVTSSPGSLTATGASSPLTVTGLTGGTAYTFTVVATNSVGDSAASSASNSVLPYPTGTTYLAPTSTVSVETVAQSPFSPPFAGNSYNFTIPNPSYLIVPADDSWAVGSGDYTAEWFQYQTDSNSYPRPFTIGTLIAGDSTLGCSIESGIFYGWINGGSLNFGSAGLFKNQWVHFAIVRRSGSVRAYKNGTQFGTTISNSVNVTRNTAQLRVGIENIDDTGTQFQGYITNMRIVKGLAVYTGNFTVPTFALTAVAAANPYGGSNTVAIPAGFTKLLLVP